MGEKEEQLYCSGTACRLVGTVPSKLAVTKGAVGRLIAARFLPVERPAVDNLKGARRSSVDRTDDCSQIVFDNRQLNSGQRHNSQTPLVEVLLMVQGLIAGQKHLDTVIFRYA